MSTDNSILDSVFDPAFDYHTLGDDPFAEVSKSSDPDAGELLRRQDHLDRSQNRGSGKPKSGRPKKKVTPLAQFNPKKPTSVLGIRGDRLLAGSVLQTKMPDETVKFLVLLSDTPFDVLGEL